MSTQIPIVTVTCLRDLPQLHLQAQSISLYLDKECPVFIVVNEHELVQWSEYFDKHIRQYYANHKLTIFTRDDFNKEWAYWLPSKTNPWATGWEIQQILKLAISTKLNCDYFLILDTQNFLIREWNPNYYGLVNGKIPIRPGHFVMPEEIVNQYSNSLGLDNVPTFMHNMSICTPIFLRKNLCDSLINKFQGITEFSKWFKNASRVKSEFILYALWSESQGGSYLYHYMLPEIEDWANPYLRDCNSEEDFQPFIDFIGGHKPHAWVSINHRAWGNMDQDQYQRLTAKLLSFNLQPQFEDYRSTYIDLKF
jgi:hypothetical protein